VKTQAADELSGYDASEKAAILLDPNSKIYKDAVAAEADKMYKSKFMTQLNKARKKAEIKGNSDGYEEGLEQSKEEHEIWYFCNVCDELIMISKESAEHNAIIDYLRENKWGHSACHESHNLELSEPSVRILF